MAIRLSSPVSFFTGPNMIKGVDLVRPGGLSSLEVQGLRKYDWWGVGQIASVLGVKKPKALARVRAGEFGETRFRNGNNYLQARRQAVAEAAKDRYPGLAGDVIVSVGHPLPELKEDATYLKMEVEHFRSVSTAVLYAIKLVTFPLIVVNDPAVRRTELIDMADALAADCPWTGFLRIREGEEEGGVAVAGWTASGVEELPFSLARSLDVYRKNMRLGAGIR